DLDIWRLRLKSEKTNPDGKQRLEDDHPGSLAAQEPGVPAIHHGRPEELEGPGGLGQREESDRLDVHASVGQPSRQRDPDEPQRQSGGEGLQRYGPDATRGDRRAQAGERSDSLQLLLRRWHLSPVSPSRGQVVSKNRVIGSSGDRVILLIRLLV